MIAMNHNEFVDYLNTMNSLDASSTGALAEAQVQTQFFQEINVRRKVSDVLLKFIRESEPTTVFLTGHAGDGKTSLLAQLLYDLGCMRLGERLEQSKYIDSASGERLLYVKDMSELSKDDQERYCREAFQASRLGRFAVVVTNTGPLINTLKRLAEDTGVEIESQLLSCLDSSVSEPVMLMGSPIRTINVARLPNFWLASAILERMVDLRLWSPCQSCDARDRCPVITNVHTVSGHLSRIKLVLDAHYRYLEEYDRRMTARQIAAHLSYSLTGGLRCEDVQQLDEAGLFDYHFANLFFGHRGLKQDPNARQMRSIAELQSLTLDQRAIRVDPRHRPDTEAEQPDFGMFVEASYPDLDKETNAIVAKARGRHLLSGDDLQGRRRRFWWSVRRFHILFSTSDHELPDVLDQLYSPVYSLYHRATTSDLDASTRISIQTLVFEALYNLYVGMPPQHAGPLHLTVRRSGTITQYVQLIEGSLERSQLEIAHDSARSSSIDDANGTRDLLLVIGGDRALSFPLTLPILDYFWRLSKGMVSTTLSPALSQGVDRLKSLLRAAAQSRSWSTSNEIRLLVLTTHGPKTIALSTQGGELVVQ